MKKVSMMESSSSQDDKIYMDNLGANYGGDDFELMRLRKSQNLTLRAVKYLIMLIVLMALSILSLTVKYYYLSEQEHQDKVHM